MMTIYGTAMSRAFRCLWLLEEIGVPYQHVATSPRQGETRTAEFLKLHPGGKVPVLQDGETTLFESGAICCYLAEKFPEARLIPPAGTTERGLCYQWSFFVTTELEQGLWSAAKHTFSLPEEKRLTAMREVGLWEFSKAAKTLEGAVQGKHYLVGESLSVADILAGQTLLWAKGMNVVLGAELEHYYQTLAARPAFQKVLAMRAPRPS